jgi:hypothetical protein
METTRTDSNNTQLNTFGDRIRQNVSESNEHELNTDLCHCIF